ncbi:hypothetical protein L6452_19774 [Arctium lappa]|uniref:Uncharacterized protein n=1 Tax=Arctium lappa TaxID=4217 RepID=A0ACB9B8Q3_ARCLA|nr:hypothetical protein L6452_19774 [Arctium lappa]
MDEKMYLIFDRTYEMEMKTSIDRADEMQSKRLRNEDAPSYLNPKAQKPILFIDLELDIVGKKGSSPTSVFHTCATTN